MKKNKLYLFVIFLTGLLFASCYDDKTTYDVNKLPDVVIDTAGIGANLSVIQYERLRLAPNITKGGKTSDDLIYSWRLTIDTGNKNFIELSDQMHLDEVIALAPSSDPYFLWLTVTDKTNGMQYLMSWKVYMLSGLGEGLVVADTKDGQMSDLHLIIGKQFTDNYTGGDIIKKNLYSVPNGGNIEGVVDQMSYNVNVSSKIKTLYIAGDKTFMGINTVDYLQIGKNENMYYEGIYPGRVQSVSTAKGGTVQAVVNDGKIRLMPTNLLVKFGAPVRGNYMVDNDVAFPHVNGGYIPASFYDSRNGKFWLIPNLIAQGGAVVSSFEKADDSPFDPNNVPNMECKKSENGDGDDICFLLKDKATGAYSIYTFDNGNGMPKAVSKLPVNRTLDEAVDYVFCRNQKVMYYATPTEIYAVILGGSVPTIEQRYLLDSETHPGEKITGLSMFRQAWYLMDETAKDDNNMPLKQLPTNNMQLLMTTYNEGSGEGKVNTLPILNLGIGTLDKANIKEYKGFNRITCVAPQDK